MDVYCTECDEWVEQPHLCPLIPMECERCSHTHDLVVEQRITDDTLFTQVVCAFTAECEDRQDLQQGAIEQFLLGGGLETLKEEVAKIKKNDA